MLILYIWDMFFFKEKCRKIFSKFDITIGYVFIGLIYQSSFLRLSLIPRMLNMNEES